MRLQDVPTPALILDAGVLAQNIARMSGIAASAGVGLRPHVKTAKCIEVARQATAGHSGAITVSTLREAEYFIANGFTNVTYGVGIVPDKLDAIAHLQRDGATVHVITDDVGVAQEIGRRAADYEHPISVLIEIDSGYGRAGVMPDDEALIDIGRELHESANVTLQGVLTHAGHSYKAQDDASRAEVAEEEREATVHAAGRLGEAGFPCPTVSVGSTPSSLFRTRHDGITEERPGNYVFFDLWMAGRGVCAVEDIAVSVLTEVTNSHAHRNHAVIDAGFLALSKDLGADEGPTPGVRYGVVRDEWNQSDVANAVVGNVSQEHGWLATRDGTPLNTEVLPVGRRLRILPNHSCATAAAYDRYYVVDGGDEVIAEWTRVNGW